MMKRLSVIVAMACLGLAVPVKAQTWTEPEATASALADGCTYYLYNVATQLYYNAGNDWDSEASLASEGLIVTLTYVDEVTDEEADEDESLTAHSAGWLIHSSKGYLKYTYDNTYGGEFWTDGGLDYASDLFDIEAVQVEGKTNVYTIKSMATDETHSVTIGYLGWSGTEGDTEISINVDGTSENAQWQLINANTAELTILYNALLEAEENSVDTEAAGEVYEKAGTATLNEIRNAVSSLRAGVAAVVNDDITGELARDVDGNLITDEDGNGYKVVGKNLIYNPSFEDGLTGWTDAEDALTAITETNFSVKTSGGANDTDKYLVGTVNAGSSGAGSLGVIWPIEKGKKYLFRYSLKSEDKSSSSNNNGTSYLRASVVDSFNTSDDDIHFDYPTVASDGEWYVNSYIIDNTDEDTQGDYVQIDFRWLNSKWGFDEFALAEVETYFVDDEYSIGDAYEDDTHTYEVLSDNMVVNGGFNDITDGVVDGWTQGNTYAGTLSTSKLSATPTTGGFNGGAYITCSTDNSTTASGAEGSPSQAIQVEEGKMYLFIGYAGGTSASGYQGLYAMTSATSESGELVNLKWDSGEDWTKTEYVFTATTPYVGIRCSWCPSSSFDGFQLYEIDRTDYSLKDVEELAESITVPTANIENTQDTEADNTFKYSATAVAALQAAIDAVDDMSDQLTSDEYKQAMADLKAATAIELVEPTAPLKIWLRNASKGTQSIYEAANNTPATVATRDDAGGYEIDFGREDKDYLAQAFTFTPVDDTLNGYTISYSDENGDTHYLCLGAVYSGDNNQIRTTTDEDDAFTFVISADETQEDIWHIWNSAASNYVGCNGTGKGFYTSDANTDIEFAAAAKASATCDFTYGYATVMLPFAMPLITNMKAYPCSSATDAEDDCFVLDLTTSDESIKAFTPYILEYSGDMTSLTFSSYGTYTGEETTVTSGLLTGSFEAVEAVPVGSYVLQYHESDAGFAFYLVGETQPSMDAYHCYLNYTTASGDVKALLFPGTTTAISSVADTEATGSEAVYDLSGRKVSRPQHGIYIKGGKKVVIK